MTSLKRSMVWDIGSSKRLKARKSSYFQALSAKLLLSYLSAMTVVLGLSAIALYQFFAYSLLHETDQQLMMIAAAARHNLTALEHDRTAVDREMPPEIDQDGDLDLPWQELRRSPQMVEWFDASGNRLASAGNQLAPRPFVAQFQPIQQDGIRSITQPIPAGHLPHPQGFVRVSIPADSINDELDRLRMGLGIGGAIALFSMGITGWWMTRRALRPVEQNMAKLRQFTADASHELRSPITAIKTAAEVMQSHLDRVHPADVKKLNLITSASSQMTVLIEDLLLLARTDDSTHETTIRVPLHEILEDLIDFFEPSIVSSGIQLQLDSLSETWIQGDAIQIRRAFLNLIDNAIKYTPQGGTVTLSLAQKEMMAVFTLMDTGIGIESTHLPYVFDRFWRVDDSRSRKVGGTGLGLAIVKAIVEAHHGRIWVKSQIGVGSCFQVEFPISK
jgi:signal transduction histidine kinase